MPSCCPCNDNGKCKSCVCIRAKRDCDSCSPLQKGRCCNNPASRVSLGSSQTSLRRSSQTSLRRSSRASCTNTRPPVHSVDGASSSCPPSTSSGELKQRADRSVDGDSAAPPSTASGGGEPAVRHSNSRNGLHPNERPSSTSGAHPPQDGSFPSSPFSPLFATRTLLEAGDAIIAKAASPWPLPWPLPPPASILDPTFTFGELDGPSAIDAVNAIYAEVVHWRRNIFATPSGKAGKAFVLEMARLLNAYAEGSAMEGIALKALMIMSHLLLEKPSAKSKSKDHANHLERRLHAWKEGHLDELIREARVLQSHRQYNITHRSQDSRTLASTFSKLMLAGKTRAALRLLENKGQSKVLPLDQVLDGDCDDPVTVFDVLKSKHPPAQPVCSDALVSDDSGVSGSHPILFDRLDGVCVRRAVLRMTGSAGPSGLDSSAWQRLCTSFKGASTTLCDAIAAATRRLCCMYVASAGVSPLLASRLIALDKCPGARPIAVGEVLRRIMGKAIMSVVGEKV